MNFQTRKIFLRRSGVAASLLLFLLVSTGQAQATQFHTCVRWQAQTVDSGFGEDRLSWANNPGVVVTAYGVLIRISAQNSSWFTQVNTSPYTGCVDWEGVSNQAYDVRVYAYVRDENGNVIRYHDGGDQTFGTYPGGTYSYLVTGYRPSATQTTYVNVGGWTPRATAMATASMMTRYFPGLTQNKRIHIADDLSGGGSSAHHCSANCFYGSDAYVRLQTGALNGDDHRRRKFITAHELGHARIILQQEGLEPNVDTTLTSGGCQDGNSYWMESREWNSVSMREGFAHFAAVWTFNYSTEGNGFIRWFNTTYDVESNSPASWGGFIQSNCGGAVDGQATNLDAMRTYWDWATPANGGPNQATRTEVMNTYVGMVKANPLQNQYFARYYLDASANLTPTKRDKLWTYGCWNGLLPWNLCH